MSIRLTLARGVGALSSWILRHVLRRQASSFPGKAALAIDHELIAELRNLFSKGSVVVVGTNGKTTVTNLLANSIENAGMSVTCNRLGANLESGVATAIIGSGKVDWGVFEVDELWLAKVTPALQPRCVLLLNLFRDQLDRVGEIELTQQSIVHALEAVPAATLVFNADDPFCLRIAQSVKNEKLAFGIGENMQLRQNTVSDTQLCQHCNAELQYEWRQYGQLGAYRCDACGFERPQPDYSAVDVCLSSASTALTVKGPALDARFESPLAGAYMAYNITAVCSAADFLGVSEHAIQQALKAYDPANGRQQHYKIDGRQVLLNLAKNPAGFNQNLRIVMGDTGPAAIAFFINDKDADGHDVSWLWDVDFQELAEVDGFTVYAGGERRNDLQVRLKYAGVEAELIDNVEDFLSKSQQAIPDSRAYIITNYTALHHLKHELDSLAVGQSKDAAAMGKHALTANECEHAHESGPSDTSRPARQACAGQRLVIVQMLPSLLNLYGDGGNVTILADRARRRGFDVELVMANDASEARLDTADIVFLGGGPDREQKLASEILLSMKGQLEEYVQDDGVLLAICGGYQIIGNEWLHADELVPGLGLVDVTTRRAKGDAHNRLVGNIVLSSPLARMPVVGFENHAGRTYLGESCQPFGTVMGHRGGGNNGEDGQDGVVWRNVIGTYLHGPLLAKNPQVADALIERALARRAAREGVEPPVLCELDDAQEIAANAYMLKRLTGHRK